MRLFHKILSGVVAGAIVSGLTALHGTILTGGHLVGFAAGWLFGALFLFSIVLYAREALTVWGWTLVAMALLLWGLPLSASALASYGQEYADPRRQALAQAMLPLRGVWLPGLAGTLCMVPGLFLTSQAIRAKMAEDALAEDAERLTDPEADRAQDLRRSTMMRRVER